MTDAERTLLRMVAGRVMVSVPRDAELLAAIKAVEAEQRSRAWDENPPPPGAREMGS